MLTAITAVLHGGQLFRAGPGDGEQEGGLVYCFHVVSDGGREGEEAADLDVVRFAMDGDADVAFETLDGDGAIRVVLLHACGGFHGDEDDSEVVFFEERSGVVAGLPRLFLFRFGDLLEEIEVR